MNPGEAGGSVGDWGGDDGDTGGITKAIRDAFRSYWGGPQAPQNWGGPQAPQNFNREAIYGFSPNPNLKDPMGNMGNIEGVPAGAYGPGPLDPMSAWGGPGWGPGVGQPAPGTGPYSGPITGTGYPGANTNYFGNPSWGPGISFDSGYNSGGEI